MSEITIYRGRTKYVPVQLSYDVSNQEISSQLRTGLTQASLLIATWEVRRDPKGRGNIFTLVLDDEVTAEIPAGITQAFMDIKRVAGGEPFPVFDDPLEVIIKNAVTE